MRTRPALFDNAQPAGGAAVHALVVGVGGYDDPTIPSLASAPRSATAFAEWLCDRQRIPELVFGSIDVLASQPNAQPVQWRSRVLDVPTSITLEKAIDAWHERAAAHPGNIAIFYFCGHGIELGGGTQSLLLQDVDLTSRDPFGNALAFDEFWRGMDSCGARRQLFVIDACRERPVAMAKWDREARAGRPFVRYDHSARTKLQPRRNPVLQSTAATQKAWQGETLGWFTEALLAVVEGAAGNNRLSATPDDYPVNTRDIASTIDYLVRNEYLPAPDGPQTPRRMGDDDFDLHVPNPPVVPIVVTADAPRTFTARRGAQVIGSALIAPWRSRLAVGDYAFEAAGGTVDAYVAVPAKKVRLP